MRPTSRILSTNINGTNYANTALYHNGPTVDWTHNLLVDLVEQNQAFAASRGCY